MERNLEEIISYMSEKFRPYEIFEKQIKRITRELIERGYSLDEITQGVNAYLLQLEPVSSDYPDRQENPEKRDLTFRVLDVTESRWIGPGAYGYMCLLREMGLLSHHETEEVIRYVMDNEIELNSGEELQQLILEMIFDSGADGKLLGSDEDYEGEGIGIPFLRKSRRRLL
jgi:uncharacterized protein Smg (DUF494 family)